MHALAAPFATAQTVPASAGVGLRPVHYRQILEERPRVGWFEVHSENYFGSGGQPLHYLESIRDAYPLSLHGVGLSLGSAGPLDEDHLGRLGDLISRIEPGLVSEHLSWGRVGPRHLNDLLPLPYTEEALEVVCDHIDEVQERLHRQILVENISSYVQFRHSTMPEGEFIARVARRTGCGILLDVNNLYVNEANNGIDPVAYLDALPVSAICEMHLAGHDRAGTLLIDTHGTRVAAPVWELYAQALDRFGPVATLIEWDTDIPPLEVLLEEVRHAATVMRSRHAFTT
ncbi:MNIO family bufferin maturase [Paraburkholderia diazotrophica]|uniref:UPF0276 protein SAMN05192539_101012 n=1 Tax=Paraburkholderia diazotrophica TaxID=667676 RepID=A0A1H6YC81_9BURK|nr:DUF692 domain-containing protein [Paraburkholderia diazotrophica]SEJ37514.1 hypothetical protein SAMN05192539_101012 [Paraburkholderia diazotrophica]